MKDNGSQVNFKEEEHLHGKMDRNMKDNIWKEKDKVLANIFSKMGVFTKVDGKTEFSPVRGDFELNMIK